MSEARKYDINIPWSDWEIVDKLGSGSFGAVYEIEREIFGRKGKAALKVITIPQNDSDIDDLLSDGYDEESITERFNSYLKDIVNEYTMMDEMKGCANIVYGEDVKYIQHDDGMGWDVFIRMELLTPLTKVKGEITDSHVVKIATDVCGALDFCEKRNVIHRDIKPQNIFVSTDGTYKLGDFGIAKTVERTTSGTKTGTYKYMAPEVYNNQPYGHKADIYSLGLVLYWLLNERRTPFLPLPPKKPTVTEEDNARNIRFKGERLPAPKHGSEELKRIVLKACAFKPEDRYANAAEMLKALKGLDREAGNINVEGDDYDEGTVGVFTPDSNIETGSLKGKEPYNSSISDETISVFDHKKGNKEPAGRKAARSDYIKYNQYNPAHIKNTPNEAERERKRAKSNKKWLTIGGAIVVVLLLCTIFLMQSISNRSSNISDFEIETATATADSGTCGEALTWTLSPDGVLTISGTGVMENYDFSESSNAAPWYKQRKNIKSIIIDEGIISIGDAAFSGCESLASVTIPESIGRIGNSAFFNCYNLASIIIPFGVISIGDGAFERCGLTSIIIPSSVTNIGNGTFERCGKLTSVSIPSSVTTIGKAVFERCAKLTSVNIPSAVTTIGDYAFCRCLSLASVTLPSSVTTIGESAFAECYLTHIYIPASVTTIGNTAFSGCTFLESIEVSDYNKYFTSIDGVLFNHEQTKLILYPYGRQNKNYIIPSSVISIGSYQFSNSSLTSVTIPSATISIEKYAFWNCGSLTDVYYSGPIEDWSEIVDHEITIHPITESMEINSKSDTVPEHSATSEISGVDILNAISADITYPNNSDYLNNYLYKIIYAEAGACYGLSSLENGTKLKITNGTEAVVIAEHSFFENDKNRNMAYSCCIIKINGKQIARWINNDYLVENTAYTPFHVEYSDDNNTFGFSDGKWVCGKHYESGVYEDEILISNYDGRSFDIQWEEYRMFGVTTHVTIDNGVGYFSDTIDGPEAKIEGRIWMDNDELILKVDKFSYSDWANYVIREYRFLKIY